MKIEIKKCISSFLDFEQGKIRFVFLVHANSIE